MNATEKHFPKYFILFSALACITIFIFENLNHRFWLSDFKVYYGGASALLNGQQVYDVAFSLGSGYYKYSPFTALLAIPFCLFSFNVAATIQFFILSFSITMLFLVTWRLINHHLFDNQLKNKNLLLSIGFVVLFNHLFREMHLGNVNVILLLLLSLSLHFLLHSKFILSGALLALVIMTKPFFILLLLPLLLRNKIKVLASFSAFLFLFLITPSIFTGFTGNMMLHKEWIQTMMLHNSSFASGNTIESLIRIYFPPLRNYPIQNYIFLSVLAGYLILFFSHQFTERKSKTNQRLQSSNLLIEWFLIIGIVPGLFRTDTQHFLLSFPLVLILICYLSFRKNKWMMAAIGVLLFFYGGNSSEILGKKFSIVLDDLGLLGISNLLILSVVLIVYLSSIQKKVRQAKASEFH